MLFWWWHIVMKWHFSFFVCHFSFRSHLRIWKVCTEALGFCEHIILRKLVTEKPLTNICWILWTLGVCLGISCLIFTWLHFFSRRKVKIALSCCEDCHLRSTWGKKWKGWVAEKIWTGIFEVYRQFGSRVERMGWWRGWGEGCLLKQWEQGRSKHETRVQMNLFKWSCLNQSMNN